MRIPRLFVRTLGIAVVAVLTLGSITLGQITLGPVTLGQITLGGLTRAWADGSAADNAAPHPWLGKPTRPQPTPCNIHRVSISSWAKQGAGPKDTCASTGIGVRSLVPCYVAGDSASYSNAAVLANEIWGYTWSHDGASCQGDECSTADSEGVSWEAIIYLANPAQGCSATIAGMLHQQFRWRVEGRGNVEVSVCGLMQCQGQDLTWPGHTISGGKAAYVGANADGAPPSSSGTIQVGTAPLVIDIPFSVFESAALPADEQLVFWKGEHHTAAPVPLTPLGELISFRGYSAVRSYGDEPGLLASADVQGWIRDSDPGLTLTLACHGKPACRTQTTSTRRRK